MTEIDDINKQYQNSLENKSRSAIKPGLDLHHEVKGEEEKKREKLRELSNALGIDEHRKEIDKLNQSVSYIAEQLTKTNEVVNQIAQSLQTGTPNPSVSSPAMDLDKVEVMSHLLEKVASIYTQFKNSNAPAQAPLIDPNIVQQKMQQSFYDNLETGESINNFIKDSLKKSVTKKVINTSLSEIGKSNSIEHGP